MMMMISVIVAPIFESVDEIVNHNNLKENCWALFSCVTVYFVTQAGSNFYVKVDG